MTVASIVVNFVDGWIGDAIDEYKDYVRYYYISLVTDIKNILRFIEFK